jgi:hypothetical protein
MFAQSPDLAQFLNQPTVRTLRLLSCRHSLAVSAVVTVRILHSPSMMCSRSISGSLFSCCTGEPPMASRCSSAKADNPFSSNHVAAW